MKTTATFTTEVFQKALKLKFKNVLYMGARKNYVSF